MHLSLPAKAARPPAGNWYYQFFGDYGPRGLRGQYRRESGQRQGRAPEGAALDGQSCRSASRPGPSREWRAAARGSAPPSEREGGGAGKSVVVRVGPRCRRRLKKKKKEKQTKKPTYDRT